MHATCELVTILKHANFALVDRLGWQLFFNKPQSDCEERVICMAQKHFCSCSALWSELGERVFLTAIDLRPLRGLETGKTGAAQKSSQQTTCLLSTTSEM
jgi:hypothetical protein